MIDLDKLYSDTEVYINGLEKSYLTPYLVDPTTTPDDYDLDVKSYCILCHAAMEDYVETIALELMSAAIEEFIHKKKITATLVALLHFKSSGDPFYGKTEDDETLITFFDYTRTKLNDVKKKFSTEIFNNHGVSLKYLKQILAPVGVDIPNDVPILSSLKKLARERGAYAHKYMEKGTIKKSITPEVAKDTVKDCINMCALIRDRAKVVIA